MKEFTNRENCYKCYRPKSSCICKHVKNKLDTKSKFVILMHPKEFRKTKNGTGHITNISLLNSEIHIGIDFTNHKRINELINDTSYEPYLLYPGENTIKLNSQELPSSKNPLIFILDSTWACSKKMLRVSKNLHNLKRVSFDHDKSSQFRIKTQPNKYCLSTIESTLCVIEELNKKNIENIEDKHLEEFLNPFSKMVDYQITCIEGNNGSVRYKIPYKS